jgi:hypothetical protein
MKRLEILAVIKTVFVIICVTNLNTEYGNAQDIGIFNAPTVRKRITNGSGTRRKSLNSAPAPVRIVYKTEYKTKETTKLLKPTGLSITILPDADVSLESMGLKKGIMKKGKAGADGTLSFDDLQPGKYKLLASLEGYQPEEGEITIQSQKISIIPIDLKEIKHEFSIQTNVKRGEVRYAPVEVLGGTNPDGTVKVREKGSYCVVQIENGKATIKGLTEGDYNIDVRAPDTPEYQPELAVVKIPEDIPEAKDGDANKNTFFPIPLEYKLSTKTFNQIYTPGAWILPQNWRIDSKGLKGSGVGVALPKEADFRYYKDFELNSSVRLLDNTSVGFVLRALDDKNYYLIKLTGAASTEQYRVSAFIVKDGVSRRVFDNPIPLANTISDQKYFTVIIKAQGDTFKIIIEDTATGKSYPLGNAVFDSNNFPIGAVGIGVMEKSSFEVGRFSVCNEICK